MEEIVVLLEWVEEEEKKHLENGLMSYNDSGITEEDQRMNIMPRMQQYKPSSSDVVNVTDHNKNSIFSWKDSLQWEENTINNSLSR